MIYIFVYCKNVYEIKSDQMFVSKIWKLHPEFWWKFKLFICQPLFFEKNRYPADRRFDTWKFFESRVFQLLHTHTLIETYLENCISPPREPRDAGNWYPPAEWSCGRDSNADDDYAVATGRASLRAVALRGVTRAETMAMRRRLRARAPPTRKHALRRKRPPRVVRAAGVWRRKFFEFQTVVVRSVSEFLRRRREISSGRKS